MVVKVYVDMRSQPSRALLMFLKKSTIQHEVEVIDLFQGENKKAAYAAKFPLCTVPALEDGNFYLQETVAIFRYLAAKFPSNYPNNWYPSDVKQRALVDQYMSFHHQGVRSPLLNLFMTETLMPGLSGKKADPAKVKEWEEKVAKCMETLETVFLKNNQFLCGKELSFADMLAVSEITQLQLSGRDVTKDRPKVKAMVEKVKSKLNPTFDEVFDVVSKWVPTLQKK